jgi:hypothetical protein
MIASAAATAAPTISLLHCLVMFGFLSDLVLLG